MTISLPIASTACTDTPAAIVFRPAAFDLVGKSVTDGSGLTACAPSHYSSEVEKIQAGQVSPALAQAGKVAIGGPTAPTFTEVVQ